MTGIELFRQLVVQGRKLLEDTVAGVTAEQARWLPPGRAMPIYAHYAHVVASQDVGLSMLRRGLPLAVAEMAGRTSFKGLPAPGRPWQDWAISQQMDMAALRSYAEAVYRLSDEQFRALNDADLERPVDLSAAGFGQSTLGFLLYNGWIHNVTMHCGEIACLKGLQGAKGYAV